MKQDRSTEMNDCRTDDDDGMEHVRACLLLPRCISLRIVREYDLERVMNVGNNLFATARRT
jgi:hypothetical protein